MDLKGKDWRRFWGKKAPKVPEWTKYGSFGKVTQNPHFHEKVQRGDLGKFFKNHAICPQKDALAEKAHKHSGVKGIIL